jgi:peptidoglycan/LPS O-acetylase OafA/YrhL
MRQVSCEPGAAPSSDLARGFIREIEGLRAIAITVVMVHRFWPQTGRLAAHERVAELGWMGVDLFFVISGFLIAGILLDARGKPDYYKNFYARRVLRIFPLYYLFISAVFFVFPLLQGCSYFDSRFVRASGSPLWYFFYLGNVPEMIGYNPPFFLAPVWSLAIEEQFYILFPLAVAVLDRRKLVGLLLGVVLFAPVFRLATLLVFPDNERVQYLATPSRFDEIALGCLLAIGFRSARFNVPPARAHSLLGGALFVFGLGLAVSAFDRTTPVGRVAGYSIVAFTCAALVLWTVVNRERRVTAFLRWRPVMYVGKLCYGLYLLHRPASFMINALLARGWLPIAPDSALAIALKYATALGLATLSWHLLERPILELKRHFVASPAPAAPSAPAVGAGALHAAK